MKLILLSLLTLCMVSCGLENQALNYNNSLIQKQHEVSDDMNAFMDFIRVSGEDSIQDIAAYQTQLNFLQAEALNKIEESRKEIELMGSFNNDSEFQQSLLLVMKLYHQGIKSDYYQMGAYYLLPQESQTPELYNDIVTTVLEMDATVETAELEFIEAQKEFGKKYGVELSDY